MTLPAIVAATVAFSTPRLASAPPPDAVGSALPVTQNAREVYEGSVYCSDASPLSVGALAAGTPPRLGSGELQVENGLISGQFFFLNGDSGILGMIANCNGSLDPVSGRGLLKVRWAGTSATLDATGGILPPDYKVSVLLKRGVITGGTMDEDGGVLAFRLERFRVILP